MANMVEAVDSFIVAESQAILIVKYCMQEGKEFKTF